MIDIPDHMTTLMLVLSIFHILSTICQKYTTLATPRIKSNLFDAIANRQWSIALRILQTPSQCLQARYVRTSRDWWGHGYNTLHCACRQRGTPAEVVRLLLAAYLEGALAQDSKGCTPLHHAVNNASDEIISMLINACPRAASLTDFLGCSPLHKALEAERSYDVIKAVILADPSMIVLPNGIGTTPMEDFFDRNRTLLTMITSLGSSSTIPPSVILNLPILFRTKPPPRTIDDIYRQTCLFLKTFETLQIPDGAAAAAVPWRVVHSALKNPSCQWEFFHMLLLIHPEQAWLEDGDGNFLLHIIAASSCKSEQFQKYIDTILSHNPRAASIPNSKQKLPFTIAIENTQNDDATIKAMFHAAPNVIRSKDAETHMVPFMAAAAAAVAVQFGSGGSPTKTNHSKEERLRQFGLVYSLLRNDPTVVVSSGK